MGNDDLATEGAPGGTGTTTHTGRSPARYRVATVALWVLVFVLWTTTRSLPYLSGFLFVVLGASALLVTTVATVGWRATMFRTATFREAAARAAWTTGALGTVVFFECVLFGPSEGLAAGANRLASSFVSSLYGCGLAAGLLAWMLRAMPTDGRVPRTSFAGSAWDLWLGRTLFAVLVAWPLLYARWSVVGPRLVDSMRMLHWPAVLVLIGLVAAIHLIGGAQVRERAGSAALAGAGTLTALAGLVQALLGIAGADITTISAGIGFLVTACFTTLIGLALITFPRDDRSRQRDMANGAALATRIAWVLFPLVTVGLMAITFIMILTPMQRRL